MRRLVMLIAGRKFDSGFADSLSRDKPQNCANFAKPDASRAGIGAAIRIGKNKAFVWSCLYPQRYCKFFTMFKTLMFVYSYYFQVRILARKPAQNKVWVISRAIVYYHHFIRRIVLFEKQRQIFLQVFLLVPRTYYNRNRMFYHIFCWPWCLFERSEPAMYHQNIV